MGATRRLAGLVGGTEAGAPRANCENGQRDTLCFAALHATPSDKEAARLTAVGRPLSRGDSDKLSG
jgi:hypothetical protein